jgi:hypothetical protein
MIGGLWTVVERHPPLAGAVDVTAVAAAICQFPDALPKGARLIAAAVAAQDIDARSALALALSAIGAGPLDSGITGLGVQWACDAGGAVWGLCDIVASRIGDRIAVARLLNASRGKVLSLMPDEAEKVAFAEVWTTMCIAFSRGMRPENYIRSSFLRVAKYTPIMSRSLVNQK